VLFTERSERSKERELTLMSVIIGKEERESYLLGWLTQVPRKGWSKEELDLSVGPFSAVGD
jgi:hypothetical protein